MTARPSTRMPRFDSQSGFTLMEIATMALIATLAGVGLSMAKVRELQGRRPTPKEDLFLDARRSTSWPRRQEQATRRRSRPWPTKYPRAIPVDPSLRTDTGGDDDAGAEAGTVATEPGIYDVKSGSEQSGLDGTPYATRRMMRNHVRSHARQAGAAALVLAQLAVIACDKMPLVAPTASTVTVTSGALVLPAGGSTEVSAFVAESGGTPVQNGTAVRFATNLGRVDPAEAQTRNGMAITTFHAGDVSGIADVRATGRRRRHGEHRH